MITCPHCALENPDGAQRCDCGWDFTTSRMSESLLTEREQQLEVQPTPARSMVVAELAILLTVGAVWLFSQNQWLRPASLLLVVVALVLRLRRGPIRS
jgi:hypothetical protein